MQGRNQGKGVLLTVPQVFVEVKGDSCPPFLMPQGPQVLSGPQGAPSVL